MLRNGQQLPYAVRGIETYATATEGRLAGVAAAADDYGAWWAQVSHTVFDASRSAEITGGTFELNGVARDASGAFQGGTVRLVAADPGCGREWSSESGSLALSGGGAGTLDATLTHFRTQIFGRCITYWAAVAGTATLTLP